MFGKATNQNVSQKACIWYCLVKYACYSSMLVETFLTIYAQQIRFLPNFFSFSQKTNKR